MEMRKIDKLNVKYQGQPVGRLSLTPDNHLCAFEYDTDWLHEGYNGEHATSVNGTGNPTLSDMIAIGTKIRMSEKRCRDIFA